MRNPISSAIVLGVVLAAFGCGNGSPAQPTPIPCSFAVSPASLSFGPSGGVSTVSVSTTASCDWTAASDRGWMTIDGSAVGRGSGAVQVSVTANASPAERSGTLTLAARAIPVRQDAAPCQIRIAPNSAAYGKDAVTGTFAVTAPDECRWSAVSSAGWLTVASGQSGAGNGTVEYRLDRNRTETDRTATIAVGGQTFTVSQAGDPLPAPSCEYGVAPVVFTPCMTASTLTAALTTQQGCGWTVESDASWIRVTTGPSGTGPSAISFAVSDNFDAPRLGVVKVRWPSPTAGQNLQIQQAGCRYAVSATSIDIAAAGGGGRFDVLQQSDPYTCGGATQNGCLWTAQADVSWITITTVMPQAGDNPVLFTVAANGSPAERIGRITVRDRVVVVRQAGR